LIEREQKNERSFYSYLPEDARMRHRELREVKHIQEQLRQEPDLPITEKELALLQRADKYQ